MNYFDKYKKRVLGNATSMKENIVNETIRDFISFLNEAPTSHLVPYTKVDELPDNVVNEKELMVINDVTNNDKKAYDEKILLCKLETDIEVGSYVFWEDNWWVLIFKEHLSFITHKKFIMTKCNQYFNYGYKGKVYKIPIAIVPLTLYSDGMADSVYTSLGDSKNRVTMGSNPITRSVDVGTRIMVTNKTVYRVTNLTDFEYNGKFMGDNGLISTLVLQSTIVAEDDKINNIAYNPISKNGDSKIKGKDYIYLSSENKYEVEYDGEVEFILDFDYINIVIISQENNKCIIRHNDSMDYIGDSMSLIARNKETKETIDMKNILVKGV